MKTIRSRMLFIVLAVALLGLGAVAETQAQPAVEIQKIELPDKFPGGAVTPASAVVVLKQNATQQVRLRVSVDANHSDKAKAHATGNESLDEIDIMAGQNRGSFQITCRKGVAQNTEVPIKAQVIKIGNQTINNGSSLTTNLTLRPAQLSSVSLPSSMKINSSEWGTIKLDGKTPPSGGKPFTITSNNPNAARPEVPAVTIPANDNSVRFKIQSGLVLLDTVVVLTITDFTNQKETKYLTVKLF